MGQFSDLKGYYSVLGPLRFWALMIGTVAFILGLAAAHIWLSEKIGWPENYGFTCYGRGCWFEDAWHSPKLLKGGSSPELGLFGLLWLLPSVMLGCVIYALTKRAATRLRGRRIR